MNFLSETSHNTMAAEKIITMINEKDKLGKNTNLFE